MLRQLAPSACMGVGTAALGWVAWTGRQLLMISSDSNVCRTGSADIVDVEKSRSGIYLPGCWRLHNSAFCVGFAYQVAHQTDAKHVNLLLTVSSPTAFSHTTLAYSLLGSEASWQSSECLPELALLAKFEVSPSALSGLLLQPASRFSQELWKARRLWHLSVRHQAKLLRIAQTLRALGRYLGGRMRSLTFCLPESATASLLKPERAGIQNCITTSSQTARLVRPLLP